MTRRTRITKNGTRVPAARRTWYDGTLFRSFLESLWARRFNDLGWRWAYEPQRHYFREEGWSYLPDFYIYDIDAHFEVKPVIPDFHEQLLAKLLAEWTLRPVYFGVGKPWEAEVFSFEQVRQRLTWRDLTRYHLFDL